MLLVLLCGCTWANAEDGSRLWLRYEQLPSVKVYRERIKSIAVEGKSATFDAIRREVGLACAGLLGRTVTIGDSDEASVIIGLPQTSTLIRQQRWQAELNKLGPEGYRIRTVRAGNRNVVVIASMTDIGALY